MVRALSPPTIKFYTLTINTMPKKLEFTEWQKFWKWTVLWDIKYSWGLRMVKCKCECWTEKWVNVSTLNQWKTKSCWCSFRKHWMTWTRIFTIFDHMKQRCTNPNNPNRSIYWWKWIKVLWNSFEEFYADMWESYNKHVEQYWEQETTIDRIDGNWNYCKENCRWATRFEQWNNLSSNRKVFYKWREFPTLSSLCKEYGIWRTTMNQRLNKYGWSLEKAIETPIQIHKKHTNV